MQFTVFTDCFSEHGKLKKKSCFVFSLKFKKAESSLKYYKGRNGKTVEETVAFLDEFERLKSIAKEEKVDEKIRLQDICMRFTYFIILQKFNCNSW